MSVVQRQTNLLRPWRRERRIPERQARSRIPYFPRRPLTGNGTQREWRRSREEEWRTMAMQVGPGALMVAD